MYNEQFSNSLLDLITRNQVNSKHSFDISLKMFYHLIRLIRKADESEAKSILSDFINLGNEECNLKQAKNIIIDYCYMRLESLRHEDQKLKDRNQQFIAEDINVF